MAATDYESCQGDCRMNPPTAAPATHSRLEPGRSCPTHYRYSPSALARGADIHAETLYVVGGLYGNAAALDRILAMAAAETRRAKVVFNGDFNWFNVDPDEFVRINAAVREHSALRGNVETEVAGDDLGAGCGCAYPDDVSGDEVSRSNTIMARLRETARAFPAVRSWLGALPMHCVAEVGAVRVAIVHGDAESLAGWAYSEQALSDAAGAERLRPHFIAARVRVIASTHTCLPVAFSLETSEGPCVLFNNGAAGMPNFSDTRYGVVTRISVDPSPHALYSARIGPVHVEAVAVHYDHARWMETFCASWPEGSAAHLSYFDRMVRGPAYERDAAMRRERCGSRSLRDFQVLS